MRSSSGLKLWNSLCHRVKFRVCSECITTATTTSVGLHVQRTSTYKDMNNKTGITSNSICKLIQFKNFQYSGCTIYCPGRKKNLNIQTNNTSNMAQYGVNLATAVSAQWNTHLKGRGQSAYEQNISTSSIFILTNVMLNINDLL